MKKNHLLVLLGFTVIIACKKDKTEPNPSTSGGSFGIVYKWGLSGSEQHTYLNGVHIYGDTVPEGLPEYWVQFFSDNTFLGWEIGDTLDSGTYSLNNNLLYFYLTGNDTARYVYDVNSTRLYLTKTDTTYSSFGDVELDITKLNFIKQ